MKSSTRKLSSLLIAGALFSGLSSQAMAGDVPPPQLNKLIEQGAVEVIESFKHDSFTGWLVKNGGEHHLYWATPDNYVVAGPLIDKKGINITSKFLEAKKPVPNYDKTFAEFEEEATFISTHPNGGANGVMYVFAEPFCGWCSKLHRELQPVIAAGLEVRWVPVSFLSAKSPEVIEYFLSSEDPIAAMDAHEQIRAQRGQVITLPVTAATQEKIEKNSEFMKRFDIGGTPGIVYEINGKAMIGGYRPPAEMNALINAIQNN